MDRRALLGVSVILSIALYATAAPLAQAPKRGGVIRIAEREAIGLDPHVTIDFLSQPYAPFLNHLANPSFCAILPREVEAKFKDYNQPEAAIGTGPFVLKSYEKGVRVVFERNSSYFMKGLPYLDGVVIEITPNAAARVSMLRAGKTEFAQIDAAAGHQPGAHLL